jgi:hypothetical protein
MKAAELEQIARMAADRAEIEASNACKAKEEADFAFSQTQQEAKAKAEQANQVALEAATELVAAIRETVLQLRQVAARATTESIEAALEIVERSEIAAMEAVQARQRTRDIAAEVSQDTEDVARELAGTASRIVAEGIQLISKGKDVLGEDTIKAAEQAEAKARRAFELAEEAYEATRQAEDSITLVGARVRAFLTVAEISAAAAKEANSAMEAAEDAKKAASQVGLFLQALHNERSHWPTSKIVETGAADEELLAGTARMAEKAKWAANRAAAAAQRALECKQAALRQKDAAVVAETLLNIGDFFGTYKEQIYSKLADCDAIAARSPNSEIIFIAESLPVINGIIQIGSTRRTLNKALNWIRASWPEEVDPLIVLSGLVFIYIVDRGEQDHLNGTEEAQRVWKNIRKRVQKLI